MGFGKIDWINNIISSYPKIEFYLSIKNISREAIKITNRLRIKAGDVNIIYDEYISNLILNNYKTYFLKKRNKIELYEDTKDFQFRLMLEDILTGR